MSGHLCEIKWLGRKVATHSAKKSTKNRAEKVQKVGNMDKSEKRLFELEEECLLLRQKLQKQEKEAFKTLDWIDRLSLDVKTLSYKFSTDLILLKWKIKKAVLNGPMNEIEKRIDEIFAEYEK